MFLPIMRFILSKFRQKVSTKFLIFLLINVIIFCLILFFTSIFTFHPNYGLGYNKDETIVRSISLTENTLQHSFLSHNFSDIIVKSSERHNLQFMANLKINDNSNLDSPGLMSFINWTERPWFLTNGSLRLTPLEASKLALWPEESTDPNDDRIVNQLMYVPMDYNPQTAPLKGIYLNANDNDWKIPLGRREFQRCPISSCQLLPKDKANQSDLIFFKARFGYKHFINDRKPNQIWAKFEIESPENVLMTAPENSINWTITYRHDSDIPVPYYKFYPYEKSAQPVRTRNYAANKTRKVAWFVSNCYSSNRRLQYARELGKYIQVDIYGRCGSYECPKIHNTEVCWHLLNNEYKFYLSFENSNCFDYITEKYWLNGLMHDILPIVMGAHPSTYKRLSPPNSYIHVDHFKTPKHLAEYLNLLDSNDDLYNKYFDWKGTGQIKQIYMWCRLCAMLHSPPRQRVYNQLSDWWQSKNTCVPITWTNMKIV